MDALPPREDARRRKRRKRLARNVLVAALLAAGLVVAFVVALRMRPPEEGVVRGSATLTLAGATEHFAPRECLPASRLAIPPFHGVALLGAAPHARLLVVGRERVPVGPLKLLTPATPYLVLWHRAARGSWSRERLVAADCSRFELKLESHHGRRPFSTYWGKAHVSCRKGAIQIDAALDFEHCNGNPERGRRALE
jgi:hypothetical protein